MTLKKRSNKKPENLLTEVELELMTAIWRLGGEAGLRPETQFGFTVKEVQGALPAGRDLAYTSVATIMKILEHKKVLSSRKKDKAHTYVALLSREEYESTTLKHVAHNVFQGDSASMVMKLVNEADLTPEALKAIRGLLNDRLAGK